MRSISLRTTRSASARPASARMRSRRRPLSVVWPAASSACRRSSTSSRRSDSSTRAPQLGTPRVRAGNVCIRRPTGYPPAGVVRNGHVRLFALGAIALALAAPACAGSEDAPDSPTDAGAFLEEVLTQRTNGQHARVWETLHPDHQDVASKERYVDCGDSEDPTPAELTDFEVVEVYEESIVVPGGTSEILTTAVTFRATFESSLADDPIAVTDTAHAVDVGGEWRWLLSDDGHQSYVDEECPDS
jgi:hypothetical protein